MPPCILLRWPIAPPFSLPRYRYADKTALLKGWRANRALARLFLETRASSKSLGRARNADVADRGPSSPSSPDKTFASLTGVGIRARGGCRWGIISCSSLCPLLDESRRPRILVIKLIDWIALHVERWSRVDKYLVARVNLLIRSDHDALEGLFSSSSLFFIGRKSRSKNILVSSCLDRWWRSIDRFRPQI